MKIDTGRLVSSLPPFSHSLLAHLKEYPEDIYFVGGIPRDIILGRKPNDIDIAVTGPIDILEKIIENNYSVKKKNRTRFLTINYEIDNGHTINIAHLRRERYPEPAALPVVEPVFSIDEDAKRRDFTINSMYLDIKSLEIIDPLSGLNDLNNRILRVNYAGSFRDDPTRMFRAIRYKTRMKLKYADETMKEFEVGRDYIRLLTRQRIMNELKKIAEELKRKDAIEELCNLSILDVRMDREHKEKIEELDKILPHTKNSWIFLFVLLFNDELLTWPITKREKKILKAIFQKERDNTFYIRMYKEFGMEELKAISIVTKDTTLKNIALLKNRLKNRHIETIKIPDVIQCITSCHKKDTCIEDCLEIF